MGKTLQAALLLAVTLLSVQVMLSDGSDAASDTLVIAELDYRNEGFTLCNAGDSEIDISGYTVTDGEGTFTVADGTKIAAGDTLVFASAKGDDFFTSRAGYEYGTSAKVVFANSSDELSVYDGSGTLVDSVCYGGSTRDLDGWSGIPVKVYSDCYLVRVSGTDTDCAADWFPAKIPQDGWSGIEYDADLSYDAVVTPFTFPESCGTPVLTALASATESVYVSIYLVSSPNVCALLADLAQSGVDVKVLIEGKPLGVDITTELQMLKLVDDNGGEVRIINPDASGRYAYVHNKYAVIDSETVVITSENWTSGNIGKYGNRGWGAIVESEGYAGYMTAVFENDFDTSYGDVQTLEEAYPAVTAKTSIYYKEPDAYPVESFAATVTPAVSPDNSFVSQLRFVASAEERVYAEQMDLNDYFSDPANGGPMQWLRSASDGGSDVRFILDSSTSSGSTHEAYVNTINNKGWFAAVAVDGRDGFDLIHNKGVIVDDSVWVGSVNWTYNSFSSNREAAVIINSAEVADYFESYFIADYGVTLETVIAEGMSFSVSINDTTAGRYAVLSAVGPDGYSYVWDLGNGTTRTTEIGKVVFEAPAAGTYTATVTLEGTEVSESIEYTVSEGSPLSADGEQMSYYLAAAGVFILGLAAALVRMRGSRRTRHVARRRRRP